MYDKVHDKVHWISFNNYWFIDKYDSAIGVLMNNGTYQTRDLISPTLVKI